MSRELVFTKPFVRDYQTLPETIRTETDRALKLLLDDPRHPSLQAKKMQPAKRGIFEAPSASGALTRPAAQVALQCYVSGRAVPARGG